MTIPAKLTRYLNNLNEDALRQVIRYIIEADTEEHLKEAITVINAQIEDFNKMFPEEY
jgi:hypothetical protein